MSAVITANNLESRDSVAPPPSLKENGDNYEWRMFFEGGRKIADSDHLDELIGLLYPGYEFLDSSEERLAARTALGRSVQTLARAEILARLTPEQVDELADWEWNVLNYGDDVNPDPYGWGEDGSGELGVSKPDVVDVWSSDVPLVLLDVSYTPYTEILPPISDEGDFSEYVRNIIWIKAENQLDFLRSLSRIGFISFGKPHASLRDDPNAL